MTTLSPCPFCGGEPIDKHVDGWSWIQCKDCGAKGPTERLGHGGEHDVAWNKRTSLSGFLAYSKKIEWTGKNNDNK